MTEKKQDTEKWWTPEKVSEWGKAFAEWKWFIKLTICIVLAIIYKSPILVLLNEFDPGAIMNFFKSK